MSAAANPPGAPRPARRPAPGGPASLQGMRRQNLALVLGTLAARGRLSRAEIAEHTGLTRAAVGSLAAELAAAGLTDEAGPAPNGRVGRPGSTLGLAERGPAGLGLEVGVEHLAACVVDLAGTVRTWVRVQAANRGRAPADVLAELATVAHAAARHAAAQGMRPAGTVLAIPGLVGDDPHTVEHAPNLGWHAVPAAAALRAALPPDLAELPLETENEANLGALAELWHGASATDFVHVSAEAGIGAALVIGGRLYRGARGFAGELGHVPVHPDGPACTCGARGCLEQYAGGGGPAARRRAERHHRRPHQRPGTARRRRGRAHRARPRRGGPGPGHGARGHRQPARPGRGRARRRVRGTRAVAAARDPQGTGRARHRAPLGPRRAAAVGTGPARTRARRRDGHGPAHHRGPRRFHQGAERPLASRAAGPGDGLGQPAPAVAPPPG